MNGLHNVHYHNSLLGLGNEGKYKPSTSIKTEQLTEKYTIKGDIGRGKFAVVRRCINNETGEEVAAKFIRKRRKGKSCRDEILREVVMLELALEHPRLVDLKEVFETQTELILITEYCAGGELFTECVIEESFSEQDVVRLLRQILEGLVYLHERNIVHLDLKPQNILLTKPFPVGDIKVCDLGFACLVNTGEDICDIIGTPDYVAPEVLSYEPLGLYTDMWSLGVLTYVMLTAHAPFTGKDNQETFLNISQVNLDFPEGLFGEISSASQDFIQKLLVKEPEDRLTAVQCLEHPWLTGIINPEKLLDVSSHEESESNVLTNEKIDDNELLTKEKEDVCEKLTEGPEAEKRTSPIFKKEITVEIESRSEVHCGIDISAVTQTTSDGDKENVEIIFNKSSNCSPSASAHIYTTQVDFIPSKISKCNVDNRSASEMGLHSPDKLTQCTASECISSNLKIDVSNDFNSNTSNLTLDVTSDI